MKLKLFILLLAIFTVSIAVTKPRSSGVAKSAVAKSTSSTTTTAQKTATKTSPVQTGSAQACMTQANSCLQQCQKTSNSADCLTKCKTGFKNCCASIITDNNQYLACIGATIDPTTQQSICSSDTTSNECNFCKSVCSITDPSDVDTCSVKCCKAATDDCKTKCAGDATCIKSCDQAYISCACGYVNAGNCLAGQACCQRACALTKDKAACLKNCCTVSCGTGTTAQACQTACEQSQQCPS